jgi:dihydrodipicolinate synthase/N-acetylneuraminate lyase
VAAHLFGEEMHKMAAEPDRRREIDRSLQDVYRDLPIAPLACATKAALHMLGLLPTATPRLPYVELDEPELAVIRSMLERHGLLQASRA